MTTANPIRPDAEAAERTAVELARNPALRDVANLDAAAAHIPMPSASMSPMGVISEAARDAQRARREADELTERADKLDQAIADHATAEKAHAAEVADVGSALEAARREMVQAAKTAEAAVLALYDAASGYDEVLTRSVESLRGVGLHVRYEDRDYCVDFSMGTSQRGEVLLDGTWWRPLAPSVVAARALYGALRARVGQVFAERLSPTLDIREIEETGLLRGAELAVAYEPPPVLWPRPASI